MAPTVRAARAGDETAIFALIRALAVYERLEQQVVGSAELLGQHLFGPNKSAEAWVAEEAGRVVGYALAFGTYSTFLTQPGLYLEDLFVLPEWRNKGIGRALLREVAALAVERKMGRLEWSVLDWNEPAIRFYRSIGAKKNEGWSMYRLTDGELATFAAEGDRP
jgi:GNAT superfamily N-acetyltransferase